MSHKVNILRFKVSELYTNCRTHEICLEGSVARGRASAEFTNDSNCTAETGFRGAKKSLTLKTTKVDRCKEYANVVPKEYEGGYTVWESSWVFLAFLDSILRPQAGFAIELGCGHGLCGLLAMSKGYDVLFQDLNVNVMYEVLIPNYILNIVLDTDEKHATVDFKGENNLKSEDYIHVVLRDISEQATAKEVLFQSVEDIKLSKEVADSHMTPPSGDDCASISLGSKLQILGCSWEEMVIFTKSLIEGSSNSCNLILACECIYRVESYMTLTQLICTCLKLDDGIAYIATKRLYFGLTGGTFQFIDFITSYGCDAPYRLRAKIIHSKMLPTSSNVVDIIEIRKHKNTKL